MLLCYREIRLTTLEKVPIEREWRRWNMLYARTDTMYIVQNALEGAKVFLQQFRGLRNLFVACGMSTLFIIIV